MSDQTNHRLYNFIGGLISGVTAITLSSPLDTARARFQVQNLAKSSTKKYHGITQSIKTIFREEGFRGFFKGYSAAVIAMPTFYSLYFTIYNQLRDVFSRTLPNWGAKLGAALSAGATGVLCDFVTSPLWVVRLRMQTQFMHAGANSKYKGFFNTFGQIFHEEGLRAFYRGIMTSALGILHGMIYFPLYDYMKDDVLNDSTTSSVLASALVSKTVASTITYPQNVLRTTLQEDPKLIDDGSENNSKNRITSLVRQIWKKHGIRGFYAGFSVDMIRVLPVNGIIFLTFEKTRQYFTQRGSDIEMEAA